MRLGPYKFPNGIFFSARSEQFLRHRLMIGCAAILQNTLNFLQNCQNATIPWEMIKLSGNKIWDWYSTFKVFKVNSWRPKMHRLTKMKGSCIARLEVTTPSQTNTGCNMVVLKSARIYLDSIWADLPITSHTYGLTKILKNTWMLGFSMQNTWFNFDLTFLQIHETW